MLSTQTVEKPVEKPFITHLLAQNAARSAALYPTLALYRTHHGAPTRHFRHSCANHTNTNKNSNKQRETVENACKTLKVSRKLSTQNANNPVYIVLVSTKTGVYTGAKPHPPGTTGHNIHKPPAPTRPTQARILQNRRGLATVHSALA